MYPSIIKNKNILILPGIIFVLYMSLCLLNFKKEGFDTCVPLKYVQDNEVYISDDYKQIVVVNDNLFPAHPNGIGYIITGKNVPPNTTVVNYRFARSNFNGLYDSIFIDLSNALTGVDLGDTFCYSPPGSTTPVIDTLPIPPITPPESIPSPESISSTLPGSIIPTLPESISSTLPESISPTLPDSISSTLPGPTCPDPPPCPTCPTCPSPNPNSNSSNKYSTCIGLSLI
jgi:hypothetical protein